LLSNSSAREKGVGQLLSMAQTLSDDLLYLIFLHAVPSEFNFPIARDDIWTISPLNFSLVCRSWRATAFSRPSLWSSIRVVVSKYRQPSSTCRFLEKWLLLSASAPLNIYLDLYITTNDLFFDKLFAFFLAECHRWNEIVICVDSAASPRVGSSISVQCSPFLRSLKLAFDDRRHATDHSSFPALLDLTSCTASITSQLRVLNVSSWVKWRFPQAGDALHLPNLLDMSFSATISLDIDNMFCVLSASPNLSSLHVIADTITPPSQIRRTLAIILPHLTRLTITTGNGNTVQCILSGLSCPILRTFTVDTYSDGQLEGVFSLQHIHSFADFFSRSGSGSYHPLAELFLHNYSMPSGFPQESPPKRAGVMKKLLKLLHSLERLDFMGLVVDHELIKLLTIPARDARGGINSPLCPLLSNMSLYIRSYTQMPRDIVEDMVESRWRAEKTLREVTICIPGFVNFDKSERMKACDEEGLSFQKYPLRRLRYQV